jgi:hypothetical protein
MYPSAPEQPPDANAPIVLTCDRCDVRVPLGQGRDQQRKDLTAFFAEHNGHAGDGYSIKIPGLQAERLIDAAVSARS